MLCVMSPDVAAPKLYHPFAVFEAILDAGLSRGIADAVFASLAFSDAVSMNEILTAMRDGGVPATMAGAGAVRMRLESEWADRLKVFVEAAPAPVVPVMPVAPVPAAAATATAVAASVKPALARAGPSQPVTAVVAPPGVTEVHLKSEVKPEMSTRSSASQSVSGSELPPGRTRYSRLLIVADCGGVCECLCCVRAVY